MQRLERNPLRQWIWRAFVQSALIPLVLVECGLIAAYMLSNEAVRSEQISHLQRTAVRDLASAVQRESRIIDGGLQAVEDQLQVFVSGVDYALLNTAFTPDEQELRRHALSANGVFHTVSDDGRAASFYANSTPVQHQDREKVLRLSQIDPLMRSIYRTSSIVSALYFNTWDSYNRIYPWFDTPAQYPHDMQIPQYNFYYLADQQHNPARARVWTEVYVDPAGLGWTLSAIAPVYRGDFLEGVAGIDITVDQMLSRIAGLNVPWHGYAMLVSRDNNILALPPMGEQDFGLRELTHYSYGEAVRREVLKPQDFNLAQHSGLNSLIQGMSDETNGVREVELGGRKQLVAWSEVPQTGWRLMMVVDEEQVFHETNQLAARYLQLGFLLIGGLLFFYLMFFAWMWLRARRLSSQLSEPIDELVKMATALGQGTFSHPVLHSSVTEVDDLAQAVHRAGQQLKASEFERQDVENTLSVVLSSTTETLWQIDARTQRIELDLRFAQRFALPSGLLTFGQCDQRVHPDDLAQVIAMRHDFIKRGGDYFDAEYRFQDSFGEYVWLLSRGRTVERDQHDHPTRIVGTFVDITRLKKAQEELHQASIEALAASKAKSLFLSSMSHELRTPLNAIHGFAQLLEVDAQEREGAEQQGDYAREIINASRHLTALVDDILDLSSIENHHQRLQVSTVDVEPLLHGCAELIRLEVQNKHLRLQMKPLEAPLQVLADPRRARQVVLNLLSNAIKYNSPQGLIQVGAQRINGHVRLWVQDTGPGLSDEQQAQLFQPFQRLGRESSSIPGSGIGLVLSRDLAQMMGGRLGVDSVVGQGSRFWLELPELKAPDELHNLPSIDSGRLKLLCVEPDAHCQLLFKNTLHALVQVCSVDSQQQALAWLGENRPALVILDVVLPDGCALTVLDALRADEQLRDVPVIVVSGLGDSGLFEMAITRGASACLNKPVGADELHQQVISLLYSGY